MPDRRRHRGPGPKDRTLFGRGQLARLRASALELCWLLDRGYPEDSALELVGNHHQLVTRQREAMRRVCCAASYVERVGPKEQQGAACLWIDGYNVLVTIEAALSGGLVLEGRDPVVRDLASVHGSYRRVEETVQAVDLVLRQLERQGTRVAHWILDEQVSNSGRLAALIRTRLAARPQLEGSVELHADADRALVERSVGAGAAVASADRVILGACERWCSLARQTLDGAIPGTWRLRLLEEPK